MISALWPRNACNAPAAAVANRALSALAMFAALWAAAGIFAEETPRNSDVPPNPPKQTAPRKPRIPDAFGTEDPVGETVTLPPANEKPEQHNTTALGPTAGSAFDPLSLLNELVFDMRFEQEKSTAAVPARITPLYLLGPIAETGPYAAGSLWDAVVEFNPPEPIKQIEVIAAPREALGPIISTGPFQASELFESLSPLEEFAELHRLAAAAEQAHEPAEQFVARGPVIGTTAFNAIASLDSLAQFEFPAALNIVTQSPSPIVPSPVLGPLQPSAAFTAQTLVDEITQLNFPEPPPQIPILPAPMLGPLAISSGFDARMLVDEIAQMNFPEQPQQVRVVPAPLLGSLALPGGYNARTFVEEIAQLNFPVQPRQEPVLPAPQLGPLALPAGYGAQALVDEITQFNFPERTPHVAVGLETVAPPPQIPVLPTSLLGPLAPLGVFDPFGVFDDIARWKLRDSGNRVVPNPELVSPQTLLWPASLLGPMAASGAFDPQSALNEFEIFHVPAATKSVAVLPEPGAAPQENAVPLFNLGPVNSIAALEPPSPFDPFSLLDAIVDFNMPEPPKRAAVNTAALPPVEPEKVELALSLDAPVIPAGEDAVFTLSGPDSFLKEAFADYSITDDFGRNIARGRVDLGALPAEAGQPRHFKLTPPLEQALTTEKYGGAALRLHIDFAFGAPRRQTIKLGGNLTVIRGVEPRMKTWDGWISMIASPPADGAWTKLNTLGIFGGMQYRLNAARRESLRKGNAPFYVENVSRQMLSRYHTEKGLWQKTVESMLSNRNGLRPLARDPSFCAPEFAEAFANEITRGSEIYASDPPLFFSLASEPSMTRLASAADFDFSPAALEEFRRWLERDVYGTVAALNEEWGTQFENWKTVVPMTTDDARTRLKDGVGNFAPWADFREFQDYTFAKVLRAGAEQVRVKVPRAKVGITGAMGPFAFGGWDWSRLAPELDVVETYDIGGARALWRDLAPGKPALAAITLPAGGDNRAALAEISRTLWQFALEGGPRGALLWDTQSNDANAGSALFDANGEPTVLAKSLAPQLNELNAEAGLVLAQSRRVHDGVALLYSPASIRLHWLFEADKLHGEGWLQSWGMDSSAERRESVQLRVRESWGKLLDDLSIGWRFMSSSELERGALERPEVGIKTLILPRAVALSDREVQAIQKFAENGGRVVADAVCGRFDEHGKVRARPALDELFGVNTSTEPVFPVPMKALERIEALDANDAVIAKWDAEVFNNLPPVFSDEPKWIATERSGLRRGAQYRLSPVLARNKNAVFLNLDISDYFRWRLHPELPRAKMARRALSDVVFQKQLGDNAIDWSKSKLPEGTQIIRLRAGADEKTGQVLALRRNPQARLHELGAEGDGNWAFDKSEPFLLAFKEGVWVTSSYPSGISIVNSGKGEAMKTIAGTLDPVKPVILILQSAAPSALKLNAPAHVEKLKPFEISIEAPPETAPPAFCVFRVVGPDKVERAHYGAAVRPTDGTLKHRISFALNDAAGVWTISVKNPLTGASTNVEIEVKDAE